MKYGRYRTSYLFLRLGLGFGLFWAGIDVLRQPSNWYEVVPSWLAEGQLLPVFGGITIVLGLLLMTNRLVKWCVFVTTVCVVGSMWRGGGSGGNEGTVDVLVRNIGLLGACLALLSWPTRRKTGWLSASRHTRKLE